MIERVEIMGKDLKGKELGTGLRQRKDGRYEARAKINGIDINLYDVDLKKLKILFEKAKEEARNNIDMKRQKITLNEWFEEWFANYKIPNIKDSCNNKISRNISIYSSFKMFKTTI